MDMLNYIALLIVAVAFLVWRSRSRAARKGVVGEGVLSRAAPGRPLSREELFELELKSVYDMDEDSATAG